MFEWLRKLARNAVLKGVNDAFKEIAECLEEQETEHEQLPSVKEVKLLSDRRPSK